MSERPERLTVAAAYSGGAIDQLAHGQRDRAREYEADRDRAENHGERRQHELGPLLIEMVEDVARRPRRVDHPGDAVVDDDRHCRKHVDAEAAAEGIDRRRLLVAPAGAQSRAVLAVL